MNQLKIVMLGPSLSRTQGGMASVQQIILDQASPEVQIKHIATHEEGSSSRRVIVFGGALWKLLWILLQRKADVVHIHVSERGSVLRKAILLLMTVVFRKPVLLHAHGSEFKEFYSQLSGRGKDWVDWTFRQCTYLLVLSESWKEFYSSNLKLTDKQVVVLPNPVNFPTEIPDRKSSDNINFVFLGRIGQRKGAFDLIKAFADLSPEQQTRSQLIMGGDGEVEEARQLVESLNLSNQITLLGWIDSEQRNALLAKADVFVLPSYNEGLPMALLEAMSWGLGVITTPVGGIPEVVTHKETGLLASPGDISQFSQLLASLIENPEFRLSLGNAARQRVAPLDVKNYWRSLVSLYSSAVGDQGGI